MKRICLSGVGALLCISAFIACSSDGDSATNDGATSGSPSPSSSATAQPLPPPILGAVAPAQGSTLGGDLVVLTGTNLDTISEVRFGTTSALFRVISSERVEAVAPAGAASVQIQVRTGDDLSNGVAYTYIAPAVAALTTLAPTTGPTVGGNAVLLTGQHFTGATEVRFGTKAAAFTVDSDTQIRATAPAGADDVDVVVTTPGGPSAAVSYSYVEGLSLVALEPLLGPTTGGTPVVLQGTAFNGATAVTFGDVPATSFTVDSDTRISAVAPAATVPGTAQVKVTTPSGTSNAFSFNYVGAPVLTSPLPSFASQNGGDAITLTGTGFTGATAVKFGTLAATSIAVLSDTQLVVIAPKPPPTGIESSTVSLTVVGVGGVSNKVDFTFAGISAMSYLSPRNGPTMGGTVVTIHGTNMQYVTRVTFDGIPGTNLTVLGNSDVSVMTPAHAAGAVNVQLTGASGGTGVMNGFTYDAP